MCGSVIAVELGQLVLRLAEMAASSFPKSMLD